MDDDDDDTPFVDTFSPKRPYYLLVILGISIFCVAFWRLLCLIRAAVLEEEQTPPANDYVRGKRLDDYRSVVEIVRELEEKSFVSQKLPESNRKFGEPHLLLKCSSDLILPPGGSEVVELGMCCRLLQNGEGMYRSGFCELLLQPMCVGKHGRYGPDKTLTKLGTLSTGRISVRVKNRSSHACIVRAGGVVGYIFVVRKMLLRIRDEVVVLRDGEEKAEPEDVDT